MASSRPAGPSRKKLSESCVAPIEYALPYKSSASLQKETETGGRAVIQRMGVTVRTGGDQEFCTAQPYLQNCKRLVLEQENRTFALQFAGTSVSFAPIRNQPWG